MVMYGLAIVHLYIKSQRILVSCPRKFSQGKEISTFKDKTVFEISGSSKVKLRGQVVDRVRIRLWVG
jgi:hypothetical protein